MAQNQAVYHAVAKGERAAQVVPDVHFSWWISTARD
jgi:hypothetical protein